MLERDAALAALYHHLARCRTDPEQILDDEAGAAAERLAAASDPTTDLTAAHALGLYHCARWDVVPEGLDEDDAAAAIRYLRPVFHVSPESVPAFLHHVLTDGPPTDPADAARGQGIDLLSSYLHTGQLAQLTQAVDRLRATIATTTTDHPDRANDLNNLVAALSMLSEREDALTVLREAVSAGREAVALTPRRHKRRARYLDNLGGVLRLLAMRTGERAILREAAQAGRDAVAAATANHPLRAAFLSNLGATLQVLYQSAGELTVLREAVEISRDAVAAAPDEHPDHAMYLHNLAGTLVALYGRTDQATVLGEAVQVGYAAVAAVPRDHPRHASLLNGLAGTLGMLAENTNRADVLREAVRFERDAVAATPDDHAQRAGYLHNLGLMLRTLFEFTDELDLLHEAALAGREAVAATPDEHPERTTCLYDLGVALQTLHERTGTPSALAEARDCYRQAGDTTSGMTFLRLQAYQRLARLAGQDEGLPAIEQAIDLLEILAPDSLARTDREHQLGRLGSLAADAAAAALAAGRPARAVELLERTGGILSADAVGLRGGDHDRLRDRHPDLATRLDQARTRLVDLDRVHTTPDTVGFPHLAASRRAAHQDWVRALAEVRRLPDFADFLRTPRIARLARHAHDGPIVYVTANPTRGDALILTADPDDPVHVVGLAGLSERAVTEHANRLLSACRSAVTRDLAPPSARTAQQEVRAILAWLWDIVVEPVLSHLGHTAPPPADGPWPRVWWCPVGAMAFLPLHAAGHHHATEPRTALDRVISSYTPTAAARTSETDTITAPTAVIVPVPDLPGAALPGVAEEATAISALLPAANLLANPTHDTVLAALPHHHIAHFACHGRADWADPARSQLILADHATAPLTVTEIGALRVSAGLAYLSACSTSVTALRLVDESLHITGAFQLAGYRHVVGTLWAIDDRIAAEFAIEFYRRLTDNGGRAPRTDRSAAVLHQVTRLLRDRYPDLPTVWAAHTHTGA
ncbi:CHAT domain-containing protein [Actinophytocola sediminis]